MFLYYTEFIYQAIKKTKKKKTMRFINHLNLLLFTIIWFIFPLRHAQEIDSVWFPATNFTYCNQGQFQVSSVNRYFDVEKSMYKFNFTTTSDINVTNLNEQNTSNL